MEAVACSPLRIVACAAFARLDEELLVAGWEPRVPSLQMIGPLVVPEPAESEAR